MSSFVLPFFSVGKISKSLTSLLNSLDCHLSRKLSIIEYRNCIAALQFKIWSNAKETIHAHFQSTGVTLAGDGRNDSTGHTARYCVYTLMEESTKVIVDLEVVDKRETGGKSAAMEKLALLRLLRRLKDVISIDHLVTDASTSIKALVRDMKGTVIYCL